MQLKNKFDFSVLIMAFFIALLLIGERKWITSFISNRQEKEIETP